MPADGTPVALNYGYNWITGTPLQKFTQQDTGNSSLDWTRTGFWLLGEGEMDGLVELWDTQLGRLMLQPNSSYDNPACFQFHAGSDASAGSVNSTGPDQGIDSFWSLLPSGVQRLNYNRWAYYAISLKWPVNYVPDNVNLNTAGNQENAQYWADLNPLGLWRGVRCRTFDADGTQNGYAFTRNPAWHYVDLLCRRKLFVEYNIDAVNGPSELPAAVQKRFVWSAIAESAAYFDEVLQTTGRPRFSGDYSLTATNATSLQACLTQVLANCRSYNVERAGQFGIVADQPRASIFTFSRKNADTFLPTDADLHTAPNRYVAKFRDLLCPAAATIASISTPDHQLPFVTTQAPHCFNAGDYIVIGNTGTVFDGFASVNSVGAPDAEGNIYTLTLNNLGTNVPVNVGAGGLIGLRYSRFRQRTPEFNHHAHQLARGAVGVGIARQRNKVSVTTDFSNTTWDQAARVSGWQMGIALGSDQQPYIAPTKASLKTPLFAGDAAGSGAIAAQIEPGDVVTVDDTLSYAYAGEYEVVTAEASLMGSAPAEGLSRTPAAGGVTLQLRPYNVANYPDNSTTFEPGWPTVPILPGNAQVGTEFPLADGFATFITGSGQHGDYFQMPDGYNPANMLCWASPQGYQEGNAPLQVFNDCDAYPNQLLQLIHYGEGSTWNGPLNWCAICWRTRNSATLSYISNLAQTGTLTCVELTLLGGEKVIFAKGRFPSLAQIPLPPGYVDLKTTAMAFPKFANTSGSNDAHGFRAYVDPNGIIRHDYQDGEGNNWLGDSQAMIVSYADNMGTWAKDPNGWAHTTLPNGKVFALAGFSIYSPAEPAAGPTIYSHSTLTEVAQQAIMPLMQGMPTGSMQIMPGTDGFDIVDHHAHGVAKCYVQEQPDGTFQPMCIFEDGEGNQWGAALSAFALLYDAPSGAVLNVAPPAGGLTWPGLGQ